MHKFKWIDPNTLPRLDAPAMLRYLHETVGRQCSNFDGVFWRGISHVHTRIGEHFQTGHHQLIIADFWAVIDVTWCMPWELPLLLL